MQAGAWRGYAARSRAAWRSAWTKTSTISRTSPETVMPDSSGDPAQRFQLFAGKADAEVSIGVGNAHTFRSVTRMGPKLGGHLYLNG